VETFAKIIDALSEKYTVNPIIPECASLIFILESPHIQELKHSAPVAGSSGKTMASVLLGRTVDKPLGILVKQNAEDGFPDKLLNHIGIMNISAIPLQKKAYDVRDVERYGHFFHLLEKLRTANDRAEYVSEELNELQRVILERFNEQLKTLIGRKCTLVPCGRFAQKFFRLAPAKDKDWSIIYDVPHPSYNSWNQARYQSKIAELKNAFKNLIE